jgi:hypothetical protein
MDIKTFLGGQICKCGMKIPEKNLNEFGISLEESPMICIRFTCPSCGMRGILEIARDVNFKELCDSMVEYIRRRRHNVDAVSHEVIKKRLMAAQNDEELLRVVLG